VRGGLGKQTQRGKEHPEPVSIRTLLHTERDPQRPGLRAGQRVEMRQHRPQQTVQRRERQRRLRLHAANTDNLHPTGPLRSVGKQRRLSRPRQTPQHQSSAPARPRPISQRSDRGPLIAATVQHRHDPSAKTIRPVRRHEHGRGTATA
jgi:hypothetical protein